MRPSLCSGLLALALAVTTWAVPDTATAAPPEDPNVPKGAAAQDNASSGSTEIGSGDTFTTTKELAAEDAEAEAEAAKADAHADDATEFDIALGGIFNTGNSRSLAGTGLSNFRLRRTIHQFGAQVAGNFGAEGDPDGDGYRTSVLNVQGLARYDVFFARRWTAFLQSTVRHDRFQSLDLRVNVDPGFAFYVLNKSTHRLWFEAGYDFQYDLRYVNDNSELLGGRGDLLLNDADPPAAIVVDEFLVNHAVRLFAGYSNKLSDKVSFDTGLEYLQSVILARRFRINYLAALNTQLVERFSLAVTFTLRYENDPLPQVRKLDTITAFSLAYRFF